jgi:hypothetical protein
MDISVYLLTTITISVAALITGIYLQRSGIIDSIKVSIYRYRSILNKNEIQKITEPETGFISPKFNWDQYNYAYQFEQTQNYFEHKLSKQLEDSVYNVQDASVDLDSFINWAEDRRLRFLDLLGGQNLKPTDQVRVLNQVVISKSDTSEFRKIKLQSRFEAIQIEAILGMPTVSQEKYPAIIALHGYTSSPDKVMGIGKEDYSHEFGKWLTNQGYVVIAPFLLNHGERVSTIGALAGLAGDTVERIELVKVLSCVDYLSTIQDVDSTKIGIYGISGGGTISLYASAIDRRINCTVCSGILRDRASSLVDYALGRGRYKRVGYSFRSSYYFPRYPFHIEYPLPEIAKLIIPTPLMFENGEQDLNLVEYQDKVVFNRIKSDYSKYGFADYIKFHRHSGAHETDALNSTEWLDRWLKN